jgi:ribose transport system substrate-binding protein
MSRKYLLAVLFVLLLGVIVGCAPQQAATPAAPPAEEPAAAAPTEAPAAEATEAPAEEAEPAAEEAEPAAEEAEPAAGEATDEEAATDFDPSQLTIGYIYLTLEHPYYQAHSGHVQDYAQELGFTLLERDGQIDAAVQANAMEDLVAQGVDGIVFALIDPAASVPAIQEALAAGIPVVTFAIPHGEEANVPFVGIPEAEATEKAGIEAANRFHEKFGADTQAKIATVSCPANPQAVDRTSGFLKGFTDTDPEAEVVVEADGKCVRDEALSATEDLLQAHPEVNVIYGVNGDSALGALAALQGIGRGTVDDVFLVSHDGSEPELIELVNPTSGLKLSVANRPRELARGTIDTLFEVIRGERPMDEDSEVRIPAEVLTPDDLEYLNQFLAEQYFSTIDLNEYAQ